MTQVVLNRFLRPLDFQKVDNLAQPPILTLGDFNNSREVTRGRIREKFPLAHSNIHLAYLLKIPQPRQSPNP